MEEKTIEINGNKHIVGNKNCKEGWCGNFGYPEKCDKENCNGLIHVEFEDECWGPEFVDEWIITTRKCDICGKSE